MTAERISAADVRAGDHVSRSRTGGFDRVTIVDELGSHRRFWFGRQTIGSSRPGARSIRVRRDGAVWRDDRTEG